MKKKIILLICILININVFSQEKVLKKKTLAIEDVAIPPKIKGCNSENNKEYLKECFNKKFQKKLKRKLKKSVFNSKNLNIGKHTILTSFVIDKNGEINEINVVCSSLKIIEEIKKALKKLKKFEPGMLNGKPVNVTYEFPLYIEIFE